VAASITASKRSVATCGRAGSARGMACRQSRVGGLIGDAGVSSRGRALPPLQVGENEGSVRGEGGPLRGASLPRRPPSQKKS